MAGQYADASVSIYNNSGIPVASGTLSLSNDMQVFTIPIVGTFPQIDELLEITVEIKLKPGYPSGAYALGAISYFEIT